MSDIQRWDVDMHGSMFESDDGPLVFHADHVAAVAAAEQRVRDEVPYSETDAAYESGVKAARDAVAAAMAKRGGYHSASEFSAVVLAAIDGVQP